MENKGLQIFTAFLDVANLIALIFSFHLVNKGIVSALSILAILDFSSIWFIEFVRNRKVANIKVETAPLSRLDIMGRMSGILELRSMAEAKIDAFNKKQESKIQEINALYLGIEIGIFFIGVLITIVIAYFLFYPASL
jgi:hypothetical protein